MSPVDGYVIKDGKLVGVKAEKKKKKIIRERSRRKARGANDIGKKR